MITLNTNGTAISQDFIDAITDSVTPYLMRLIHNGSELDCSIVKATITKGAVGTLDAFNVGAIISSYIEIEVKGLTTSVKGSELEVQIGLADEYITLGHFTITESPKNIYSTTLKGFGACVSKTTGNFTSPQDMIPPKTLSLANIATEIASETGVSVLFDTDIYTSHELMMPMSGLTTYQALQALAEAVGGYAVDTNDGNIFIHLYKDTPTTSISAGRMRNLPNADETDFIVTGVMCNTPSGSESSGTVDLITESNWVWHDIFPDYASNIIGYQYRPAVIGLTLGDPRIEGCDVVEVINVDGSTYNVPCHQITHVYSGGVTTSIESAQATQIANKIATTVTTAQDGESAVTLRIDSSRGTVFKNSEVSTILTVAIYYKGYRITDLTSLHNYYDFSAYLQWFYQGFDESQWHTMASSDPRLSNDGFTLTLTPQDVNQKIVFQCNLLTT